MDSQSPAASARRARLFAAAAGLSMVGLVGAFVLMTIFIQEEVPLLAAGPVLPSEDFPRGGLVFVGAVNVWEVQGRLLRGEGREVTFALDLTGPTGQPAPTMLDFELSLLRPGYDKVQIPLPHRALGPGRFIASARLPEAGDWQLRLQLPDIAGVFSFEVED
ncbi:MAG: hypothetical protein JJT85_09040 [Chromatiales bacterium]|nr:hypothetical protein [Chromatiales bacterium]